jgi:hypothetical protein
MHGALLDFSGDGVDGLGRHRGGNPVCPPVQVWTGGQEWTILPVSHPFFFYTGACRQFAPPSCILAFFGRKKATICSRNNDFEASWEQKQ